MNETILQSLFLSILFQVSEFVVSSFVRNTCWPRPLGRICIREYLPVKL